MDKDDEQNFRKYLKKQEYSLNTITSCLAARRLYCSLYDRIDAESLQQFKHYLVSRYKPATVNSRINGINRYLDYLDRDGYRLPVIRMQQAVILDKVISQEDYEILKNGLREDQNLFWYFVVRFLACTGARVSELIQIKAEHLRLGYVDLYTKGGKARRIYFPNALCSEALEWLRARGISSGFIFTGRNGRPITPRGISSQLKILAGRYGVSAETVYPHSFRHRFAKNFLSRFNDISLLADFMGHESIETTRVYLTQTSGEQREMIDRIVTW